MPKRKIIDTIIRPYFLLKRIFLHSLDLFIPNKMRRKHVRAYLTFGKIKETINPQPYSHKIAVAFCFDENLWRQATVTILSLLINSPKVSYDIYCIIFAWNYFTFNCLYYGNSWDFMVSYW